MRILLFIGIEKEKSTGIRRKRGLGKLGGEGK